MSWDVTAAAWVQAVGSVLGIFTAVGVGAVPIFVERRRAAAQSRVVAFRLQPLLLTLHADVERALVALDALEPGTNNFPHALTLTQAISLPTQIPDEIFSSTWSLPPTVAVAVAQLENSLREYTIASSAITMAGSIAVIPQESRTEIIENLRAMLRRIDLFALAVGNHCTKVGEEVRPKIS